MSCEASGAPGRHVLVVTWASGSLQPGPEPGIRRTREDSDFW